MEACILMEENKNDVENIMKSEVNNLEFPEGMRVLAVDDNSVCLAILTALLKKCRYQVTSLRNKTDALAVLKQNVDNFDIVLTNVNIDEMDGFKLLEAGLELDIPVIMISASESKSIIMKGVRYGAVDYLIKPVRLEAVQTIWQHVYRKKIDVKEVDDQGGLVRKTENSGNEDVKPFDNGDCKEEIRGDLGMINKDSKRFGKRKCSLGDDDDGNNDGEYTKRERIKWTSERHEQFLKAVDVLGGIDHAVPKKILELMNEPDLTREKVASHLQKFRKLKKKLKNDENEKHISNNINDHHPFLFNSYSSLGSSMATTSSHQPIPSNTMLPRPFSGQINYPPQANTNGWWRPESAAYMPPLVQDMPHQLAVHQTRMMPINGNFMSPFSSSLYTQPSQQPPLDSSFDLRVQAPEEIYDFHTPYEQLDYLVFDSLEDGKKEQNFRT